jgi:hypothetical protein
LHQFGVYLERWTQALYRGLSASASSAARAWPSGRPSGKACRTRLHWEAAYVAPAVPLVRGWERQLDTAGNPLFYDADLLNPDSYRAWLIDSGVRYVALPDAPLGGDQRECLRQCQP